MTIATQKRALFAGFVSIATFVIMASCGNDTGAGKTAEQSSSGADTAMAADSSTAAKPIVKKRKGHASGTISASTDLKMEKDKEGVYSRAEKMPEYPGGEHALSKFVEDNINYPQDAIDQDMEGTVNVSFVVDEKGKVVSPQVIKTAGHGLDEEAVKVIRQLPAWKPGMVKGRPVKTRLTLPVTFKLADA